MQAHWETCWTDSEWRRISVTFPSVDTTFKSDTQAFLVVRPHEMLEIGHPEIKIHCEDIGIVIGWTREEVERVFWANHMVLPVGLIDLQKFISSGWKKMAIAGPEQAGKLGAGQQLTLSSGS